MRNMKKKIASYDLVFDEILERKYHRPEMLVAAKQLLTLEDQTEEDFLGAQVVLLINGLM